jgi:hypothetical protein
VEDASYRLGDRVPGVVGEVDNADPRALGGQAFGRCLADAGRGAGDERDLAVEGGNGRSLRPRVPIDT